MSEYYIEFGPGYLPARAKKITEKYGATVVNYTDAQCVCGRNCLPYTCVSSRRHWIVAEQRGRPFDDQLRDKVMSALSAAGIAVAGEAV